MENYNVLDQKAAYSEGLTVSEEAQGYLQTTAGWGLFFSILMFLFGGLCLIGGIAVMASGSMMTDDLMAASGMPFGFGWIGVFYILLALFYFIPGFMLLRYSMLTRDAVRLQSTNTLTSAFKFQKNMYMLMGILTILFIVLYFVFIGVFVSNMATLNGGY